MTNIFHPSRRRMLDLMAAALVLGPASTALAQAPLKIGFIGAGNEGAPLGTEFAKLGHKVMFSTRHPEELKELVAKAGPNASAGSVADAVAFGDVIFVVVPYMAIQEIGQDYGKALAAKPLIVDVSNPTARDGDFTKWVDEQGGAGLATQKMLPGAHIVRAFNNLGHDGNHGNDVLVGLLNSPPAQKVGLPIAGNEPGAIALASKLIRETGFEPVLIGGLDKGKYLVPASVISGVHTPDELRKIAATLK